MEYQYDDRQELAHSAAQNDLFVWCQMGQFNDIDARSVVWYRARFRHAPQFALDYRASSRINDNWKSALKNAYLFSKYLKLLRSLFFVLRRMIMHSLAWSINF